MKNVTHFHFLSQRLSIRILQDIKKCFERLICCILGWKKKILSKHCYFSLNFLVHCNVSFAWWPLALVLVIRSKRKKNYVIKDVFICCTTLLALVAAEVTHLHGSSLLPVRSHHDFPFASVAACMVFLHKPGTSSLRPQSPWSPAVIWNQHIITMALL